MKNDDKDVSDGSLESGLRWFIFTRRQAIDDRNKRLGFVDTSLNPASATLNDLEEFIRLWKENRE